jgi:hypothetical protein
MSTAALPIYCYQSLTELDAIRLIHLYPARETASQLQCSIEQSTLAQYSQNLVHHYIALSYVWGDPVSTRSIVVEGYSLSITTNLDSSLRISGIRSMQYVSGLMQFASIKAIYLREMNRSSRWVLIYSAAQHNIIYLGDSDSDVFGIFSSI